MRWLFLLMLACGQAWAQEPPAWFAESLLFVKEDAAEAAKEGKRVMLYFGQDGCPYCKRLMEVNFREPRIVAKMQKSFVAVAINIWGDREVHWEGIGTSGRAMTEKQLTAALKIQFTPTLLFLDEKGGVALRVNGYLPPERFEAALDYVAGKMENKLPFAQFPAASSPVHRPEAAMPAYDLRRKGAAKHLLVVVETPGTCAACDELRAVGFKREEVRRRLERFDVAYLAALSSQPLVTPAGESMKAGEWVSRLKVGYYPTLIFFNQSGREVHRVEAYMRPFHLARSLDYVATGAYRTEPSFQRFLQSEADRMRARGETVDLWN